MARLGSSPPVRGTLSWRSSDDWATTAVHPRLCGEHDQVTAPERECSGYRFIPACAGNTAASCWCAARVWRRFIPACAGNTARAWGWTTTRWASVHPRLCGEHGRRNPPAGLHIRIGRFIPACAGNTTGRPSDVTVASDTYGSSPPVRGTLDGACALVNAVQCERFIPACAGNTLPDLRTDALMGSYGSSPPVRGTRANARAPSCCMIKRFIPACAGNTMRGSAEKIVRRCGRFIPACAGNTRLRRNRAPGPARRFIPACAGNTPAGSSKSVSDIRGSSPPVRGTRSGRFSGGVRAILAVHPRLCGEHSAFLSAIVQPGLFGSSPPVRGTPVGRARGE